VAGKRTRHPVELRGSAGKADPSWMKNESESGFAIASWLAIFSRG
jgi:hypothetical protein